MHKGIIAPCTCQCFHIGSENELVSSAVIFALKYSLITRDLSCDWEQMRRECFQFTSFRQELDTIIMSPNKIIPSLKWGHSNILSLGGFNFVLDPEKQKNAAQEINLSQEPFMLMEMHTQLSEPHSGTLCKTKGRTNISKSLVKPTAPMKCHLPP